MSESEEEFKRANNNLNKENVSNSLRVKFENQEKNDMMNFKDDEGNGDVEKSVDSAKTDNNNNCPYPYNNDQLNKALNFTVISAQNKDKIPNKTLLNFNNDNQQTFPNNNPRMSNNQQQAIIHQKPFSNKDNNQILVGNIIENSNMIKPLVNMNQSKPNLKPNLTSNVKNNQIIQQKLVGQNEQNQAQFQFPMNTSANNVFQDRSINNNFVQKQFRNNEEPLSYQIKQLPFNQQFSVHPNSNQLLKPPNMINQFPQNHYQMVNSPHWENDVNRNPKMMNRMNPSNNMNYAEGEGEGEDINDNENTAQFTANKNENAANFKNPKPPVVEEEEIKCEDHFNKFNSFNTANRYCTTCRVFCCDSCVIDFHAIHILQAKNKLEDIFKQTRNEIDDLKTKTSSLIKHENSSSEELSKFLVYQIKSINNNFKQKEANLNLVKRRIDDILQLEKDLLKKLSLSLEEYIKEECLNSTEELISSSKELSEREEELSKDFDSFRKFEKGDVVKQNVISILKQEYTEKASNFHQINNNNKEKLSTIEKNISSIFSNNAYQQHLNRITSSLNDIFDKQANFYNQFHKESYGKASFVQENQNNNSNIIDDEVDVCVKRPNISKNMEDYNMKFDEEDNVKLELDNPMINFIEANSEKLNFLGCVKQKTDELYIYDSASDSIKVVKNKKSNFAEKENTFDNFPDNCKYINLGQSVLFTGGTIANVTIPNCYLLFIEKKGEEMEISIMPYSNMIHERERHNIIYIKDRNYIVVCSGFFNDFAEFSDLSTQKWFGLPKMNKVRANATMAYVSNRFVYCIGGYHVKEKKQAGVYLNSCEFLDLDQQDDGWRTVEFEGSGHTIKNCAMGVVPISLNSVLLCGGYDGNTYKNEVYKLKFDEDQVSIEKKGENLPGTVIFLHSQFARLNKFAYNFDSNMNLLRFDPSKSLFEVIAI